jgi:hypothetical protein
MALMIQPTTARQNLNAYTRIRHIAAPLTSINGDFVPCIDAVLCDAKHISLHATVWKHFKN